MDEELRRILHAYLAGLVSFDAMTDWVAIHIWDAPNVENSLIDQVGHLLAFLDDSLLSEDDFREEVRSLLSNIIFYQYPPETTAVASSSTTHEEVIKELAA